MIELWYSFEFSGRVLSEGTYEEFALSVSCSHTLGSPLTTQLLITRPEQTPGGRFTRCQPSMYKNTHFLSLALTHLHLPSPPSIPLLYPSSPNDRLRENRKRGHDPSDGIEISLSCRSLSKHELTATLADKRQQSHTHTHVRRWKILIQSYCGQSISYLVANYL